MTRTDAATPLFEPERCGDEDGGRRDWRSLPLPYGPDSDGSEAAAMQRAAGLISIPPDAVALFPPKGAVWIPRANARRSRPRANVPWR